MGAFPAAVLWDFDGTLVDTEPLWLGLEREALEAQGGTWRPALAGELVGTTMEGTARVLLRHAGRDDVAVAEVADGLERSMHRHLGERPIRWRPGGLELLAQLEAAGVAAADCVVVEDSPTVVAAGTAAGAWVVAVRGVLPVGPGPRCTVVDTLEALDLDVLRRLSRAAPLRPGRPAGPSHDRAEEP